jgi:hypothetical protein
MLITVYICINVCQIFYFSPTNGFQENHRFLFTNVLHHGVYCVTYHSQYNMLLIGSAAERHGDTVFGKHYMVYSTLSTVHILKNTLLVFFTTDTHCKGLFHGCYYTTKHGNNYEISNLNYKFLFKILNSFKFLFQQKKREGKR